MSRVLIDGSTGGHGERRGVQTRANGVAGILPCCYDLQVCQTNDGATNLTLGVNGQIEAIFVLTEAQRDHLVRLLLGQGAVQQREAA